MPFALRKIIVSLILTSSLAMAFFGLAGGVHGANGEMPGECPFSAGGASICPENTLAVAVHHISSYRSFLSVPLNFGNTLLIVLLFLGAVFLVFWSLAGPPFRPSLLASSSYDSPPAIDGELEIKRWLSLFENSPSSVKSA